MPYFKVMDLYNRISELKQDKMEYVDVSLLGPDDSDPVYSLEFSGIESSDNGATYSVDYDPVESTELPNDYDNPNLSY